MKHHAKLPSSRGASSSSSPAPAHRLSHAIAKTTAPPRNKIRIIHVLAPEVIKTEPRHFRELVQRLTGKPPDENQKGSCASSASTAADASPSPPTSVSSCDTAGDEGLGAAAAGIGMKVVKEETESSSSPSGGEGGGFLRAFELDGDGGGGGGFYQGLEDFLFSPCDMDGVAGGGFNFGSGACGRF